MIDGKFLIQVDSDLGSLFLSVAESYFTHNNIPREPIKMTAKATIFKTQTAQR
jgi:hypothetical protein